MRKWDAWLYGLILLALVAVPFLPLGTDSLLTLMISLFTIASLAASWNILAGLAGRISLGHAAFFGLGALTTRELWLNTEWALIPAFVAGGVVAAVGALIIGAPALRLKGIYFSVGTLALAEALRLTASTALPQISRLPAPMLREYERAPRYLLALAVLAIIIATVYWLRRSKLGLGMMAGREDEEAAESIGVDVFRHTLLAFVLSAFFAGLAGGAFAFFHPSYYHSLPFGPEYTFDALLVTFIGGIGTLAGPLIGAVFFVLVSDILAANLVNIHLVIFGALFIFVVLVLPGGIIEVVERTNRRFIRPLVERRTIQEKVT